MATAKQHLLEELGQRISRSMQHIEDAKRDIEQCVEDLALHKNIIDAEEAKIMEINNIRAYLELMHE